MQTNNRDNSRSIGWLINWAELVKEDQNTDREYTSELIESVLRNKINIEGLKGVIVC